MEVNRDILRQIGFTKAEIDVYFVLLKSKGLVASEITIQVQMQRPNVYDALDRLIAKGLASYVIKNNVKYFQAVSPEKIKDYVNGLKKDIEDKEKQIIRMIPDLKKLSPLIKSKISVETYEGKEGMRTILFDSVRETRETKKEILGIGINNLRIQKQDPIYFERYARERAKIKAKSRYLISEGTKIFSHKDAEIRILPKELESPTATYIYGNKVTIWLWFDVPIVILIDSEEVSDSYRSYFELLWKQSKK